MMAGKFHIVVEGQDDLRFLMEYLGHIGCPLPFACFKDLGGKSLLSGHVQTIRQKLDEETKVIVIHDADEDYAENRKETEGILGNLNVPLFLFPDNKSEGALEDLLEKIIIPEHKGIFVCFEDYIKCLKEKQNGYILPDMKGKIYAYKEAVGALKENPFNPHHWDFDNSALTPLKKFLTKHISGT